MKIYDVFMREFEKRFFATFKRLSDTNYGTDNFVFVIEIFLCQFLVQFVKETQGNARRWPHNQAKIVSPGVLGLETSTPGLV